MIDVLQVTSHTFAEGSSGIAALGVDVKALVLQIVTFVIVFLLLKKFAFSKIVATLEERRRTIDDGVKLGREMADEKAKLESQIADIMRKAREQADGIITAGHQEASELIKKAEDDAMRRVDTMLAEGQAKITDELARARKGLEKEMLALISEATEAIIGEKLDAKKDAKLIERTLQKVEAT